MATKQQVLLGEDFDVERARGVGPGILADPQRKLLSLQPGGRGHLTLHHELQAFFKGVNGGWRGEKKTYENVARVRSPCHALTHAHHRRRRRPSLLDAPAFKREIFGLCAGCKRRRGERVRGARSRAGARGPRVPAAGERVHLGARRRFRCGGQRRRRCGPQRRRERRAPASARGDHSESRTEKERRICVRRCRGGNARRVHARATAELQASFW